MTQTRVTGEILLPSGAAVKASAVARVQLLDTSLVDAPASTVASTIIYDVASKLAKGEALTFELDCTINNPAVRYSVSVHVDQEGHGKVSLGDFVNGQSYPALTYGYPNVLSVQTVKVV